MRSLKGQKKLPPRFSDILDEYAVHLKLELGRGDNTVSSYLGDIMQFCEFAAKNGAGSFADIPILSHCGWEMYARLQNRQPNRAR